MLLRPRAEPSELQELFEHFQGLLQDHQQLMVTIADLGEKSGGEYIFDRKYLDDTVDRLRGDLLRLVERLNLLTNNKYMALYGSVDRILLQIEAELRGRLALSDEMPLAVSLDALPLDRPELVGGKANALALIRQSLGLKVPDGFVVTTRAYRRVLEHNRLEDRIHAWLESWASAESDARQASRQIQYSILSATIPSDVASAIRRIAERKATSWAVRSSAYGEDGELSFAGLHETVLEVPARELLTAYRRVLASLFSHEALTYRREKGMLGEEAAMAVLFQEMVRSEFAGVIHTVDVTNPGLGTMVIYASRGPGRVVVEGTGEVERLSVKKSLSQGPWRQNARVDEELSAAGASQQRQASKLEARGKLILGEEAMKTLTTTAITLERFFKRPQEIEWAVDRSGCCWILQSRALGFSMETGPLPDAVCESCSRHGVLVRDSGVVAHAGVGAGPVYRVRSEGDMPSFPDGAVLLTRYTAPWLAAVVPKAAAIVAERGSCAGHLATIAREFRVPTLLGVEGATQLLPQGEEVTVDAKQRVIYRGVVKELLMFELAKGSVFEESPEFRLLRRLLRRIAPLHLVDPNSPEFTPQGCRSVHDVIRFAHEKAVQELMDLPHLLKRFRGIKVWRLVSEIPMGLKVLDMGDGVDLRTEADSLLPEHVMSTPFKCLWRGLSEPGIWSTAPVDVDFKGMMSSLTKTKAEMPGFIEFTGFNLAVITGSYMNLHLRLGYHLNLIDARMETEAARNHIYFRFVGGVTDITRRSRRAHLLAQILSRYDFKVDIKGDLIVARILHATSEEMESRLEMLGRLIGFTRQLDIQLRNEDDVLKFAESFLRGDRQGRPPTVGGNHERPKV
ncbi:MAG: PEP/pyruvate-binding domain-containing protein [Thermodesulfobacteriota bacterium]